MALSGKIINLIKDFKLVSLILKYISLNGLYINVLANHEMNTRSLLGLHLFPNKTSIKSKTNLLASFRITPLNSSSPRLAHITTEAYSIIDRLKTTNFESKALLSKMKALRKS